jgi:16S rRNA processing protein RimM
MQVIVGRIARPHGIRGEVSVEVHTDEPGLRFAAGSVLATEPADRGPLAVAGSRWHSGRLIVTFADVTDRTTAEDLRGTWLAVDSAKIDPPSDPDEFADYQLIGLSVVTTSGDPVGVVADVLHHGQDLLVIRRRGDSQGTARRRTVSPLATPSAGRSGQPASGSAGSGVPPGGPVPSGPVPSGAVPRGAVPPRASEVLVPFVGAIVPEVDVTAGRLVIDPPPGLLNPDEAI